MKKPNSIDVGLAVLSVVNVIRDKAGEPIGRHTLTFQDIADCCIDDNGRPCSRERIRQIFERALKRIRIRLQCAHPEDWEDLKYHVHRQ